MDSAENQSNTAETPESTPESGASPFESAKPEDFFAAAPEDFGGREYDDAEFDGPTPAEMPAPPPVPADIEAIAGDARLGTPALSAAEAALASVAETEAGDVKREKLPKGRYQDRELSWLDFNQRVFEQAQGKNLALLERIWFLTIFASNLDEFYMVRVAGLKRRIAAGIATVAASGLTPRQLADAINERAQLLTREVHEYFHEELNPLLVKQGIVITRWEDLEDEERERLHSYFRRQIFPVLSPLAVDPSHPFPYISGLSLNLAVSVRNPNTGKEHFARVKVPPALPRLIAVTSEGVQARPEEVILAGGKVKFVPLEDVMGAHLDHLFPGMEILEVHPFRVTRNEDLEVEEDDAENLLTAMETELLRRRFGPAVRLEVSDGMPQSVLDFLVTNLGITPSDVFHLLSPLDLRGLEIIHDLDLPKLRFKPYVPVTARGLAEVESAKPGDIFASIRNGDVLLHHPYDSFSTSVQQFIMQAAHDPNVLAIKQTLYRTSGDSPIVAALIDAAEAGKQVVAIVEIKARFDEEANITWARKMERAGVHVVYGMVGLKTHCKLCLVVRQEADGLHRYCHVGTGNYHPKTARGYEDLGLLTCDAQVAQDLTRLFNLLSGYAPRTTFHRLLVAPRSIRDGLIERIEREVANHAAGRPSWIRFKFNSIVDERIADALYRASQAGVKVDIQVRGICSLKAGVPGLSENLKIHSVLGRYLEHSRIFAFCNNEDPEVWIGSADLMHRNLDRRVEALVRIVDTAQVKYLVDLVTMGVSDETSSWRLGPEQKWHRVTRGPGGKRLLDLQEYLMSQASARVARR